MNNINIDIPRMVRFRQGHGEKIRARRRAVYRPLIFRKHFYEFIFFTATVFKKKKVI